MKEIVPNIAMPARNPEMAAARNMRLANSRSGRRGSGAWRSQRANSASSATESAASAA
jgi:hypothetical protein